MSTKNRETTTIIVLSITMLMSTGLFASSMTTTGVSNSTNSMTAAQLATNLQNDFQQLQNDFGILQNDLYAASTMLQQQPTAPTGYPPVATQAAPLDCTGCALLFDINGISVGNCTNANATSVTPAQATACKNCVISQNTTSASGGVGMPTPSYVCQCLDSAGNYSIPIRLLASTQMGAQIDYKSGQLIDVTQGTTGLPPSQGTGQGPQPGVMMSSNISPASNLGQQPMPAQKAQPSMPTQYLKKQTTAAGKNKSSKR